MKQSKKAQKKLQDRLSGYQKLLAQPNVSPGQYTQPGSRNRRKS
jgi:hypothetical protein